MHTSKERDKLLHRAKRIQGQMEKIHKSLQDEHDCQEVLMLLAAARGGINSLMHEVLEDHIRLHLLDGKSAALTSDLGEELIDLVRAYLK